MCHDSALVERPNCSSTSTHSSFDQPWPPCSRACRPPWSSAAMASDLMRATSSSVICAALGLLLEREQDLLDEAPRARLELGLLLLESGVGSTYR